MSDLTDRDEQRFAALRERLSGVARHEPESRRLASAPGPVDPMLATTFDGDLADLDADRWIAEQKFDGTRVVLQKFDDEVTLYTRRHVERSQTLPDLCAVAATGLPNGVILDGEYTFLDSNGDSQFMPIHAGQARIQQADLTPQYLVFDVLAVDHEWCTRRPLEERKAMLEDLLPTDDLLGVVEVVESDIPGFFDELVGRGEEGIILKRRGSAYHVGTRSANWRKVKATTEREFVVVGYTPGEGTRASTFGALVLTDGTAYVGRVGSGFSDADLDQLSEDLRGIDERPVPVSVVGSEYTPVDPFVVRVEYLEVTTDGHLRAPVFVRTRRETPIDDVQPL